MSAERIMEFLRNAWPDALNAAWAWVVAGLIVTAIMSGTGWDRSFSEKAKNADGRHAAAASASKKRGPGAATEAGRTAGGAH